MRNRLIKVIIGNTLASFFISCVIEAGLGCFSITAAIAAVGNWLGLSLGVAGMIVELILLGIAIYKKEGVGWATILNATYGSLLIDVFLYILPSSPYLVLGLLFLPFAWALMGSAGLGDTSSNTVMNAVLKSSKMNISVVRTIEEFILLFVGFLGARDMVTPFTIMLMIGLGPLLQIMYKAIGFDPTAVEHKYLIKWGGK